jgi:hypothetical protein
MYGSDNMAWPGFIGFAISIIEEAPFFSQGAEARYPLQQCRSFPSA